MAHVHYLIARKHYSHRRYEAALRNLQRIGPESREYAAAQYLTALCYVGVGKAQLAARALERALQALEGLGRAGAALRDLSRLGLARLYYSAAFRAVAPGKLSVDARTLEAAIRHFEAVDVDGPSGAEALLEQAWAWFVAGADDRALGNLHTLDAPQYAGQFLPERELLRAAVHWQNCDSSGALHVLLEQRSRHAPALAELERTAHSFRGANAEEVYFRFAERVRAGRSSLGAEAAAAARSALATRELDRHFAYVASIDAEQGRLRRSSPGFRDSSLGYTVLDSLTLARDLAVHRAGAAARHRFRDRLDALRSHVRRIERLLERPELRGVRARRPSTRIFSVAVYDGSEHELWPFDGEYWRDELGSYRERVLSSCSSDRAGWAPHARFATAARK